MTLDIQMYVEADAQDRVSVLTPYMRELLYGPLRGPGAPAPTEPEVLEPVPVAAEVETELAPDLAPEPVPVASAEPEDFQPEALEPEVLAAVPVGAEVEPDVEPDVPPEPAGEPELVAVAAIAVEVPSPRRRRVVRLVKRVVRLASSLCTLVVVACVLLLTIGPRFLPFQAFYVRTGSMRPTIPVGALVIATRQPASALHVGDIIVFDRPDHPGDLVTHRIAGIENSPSGPMFVTKGDANGAPDGWRIPVGGTGWRYKTAFPYAGYVVGYLQSTLKMIGSQGAFVILAMVSALFGIWRKPTKKPTTETQPA